MSELKKIKLKSNGFTFKRFFVAHDKSPMKITTDSCLLGAWAPIYHQPKKVLDIGCGCGIIGLMLAQRLENTKAIIEAIDIDPAAIEQTKENIKSSPFHQMTAKCTDIKCYAMNFKEIGYDLIVTNPPYFESAVECRNEQRQKARYTEQLNYQQLIDAVKKLLSPKGLFSLVLPAHFADIFTKLCLQNEFYLKQILQVQYKKNNLASLTLLTFSLQPADLTNVDYLIMREENDLYTEQFRELLKDFYLFQRY